MRRHVLPVAVLLTLVVALVGAAVAPTPQHLPAVALGAVLVWRAEIAAVVFAASYGAIVVLRLALHGETLTRVGRDGIEVPRVGAGRVAQSGDAAASSADLQTLIRLLEGRVATSDDPTDPLLRNEEEQIYHDRDAD